MAARVRALIERIRAPIDRAMDRVVTWIVGAARRLGRFVAQAGVPNDPQARLRGGLEAAAGAVRRLPPGPVRQVVLGPIFAALRTRYGLGSLSATLRDGRWWVTASMSPPVSRDSGRIEGRSGAFDERTAWERILEGLGPEVQEVRISGHSIDAARTALLGAIARSGATDARKQSASAFVASLVDRAAALTDPHQAYLLLQQAGAVVSGLPGVGVVINIHHSQEVADYPSVFVQTRTQRIRVPRRLQAEVRQRLAAIGQASEFDEMIRLIKAQQLDMERDRRPQLLAEIDLIVADARLHRRYHRLTRRR